MNLQEAFDYAVQKMVEQGKRCVDNEGNCIYDDKQGNHCGIGWLLDHDKFDYSKTPLNVISLAEYEDIPVPDVVCENLKACEYLQRFHDYIGSGARKEALRMLSNYIDTSKPQYQQWVELGE